MAQKPESASTDSIVLTGLGCVTGLPCNSESYLKAPKSRKFMGGQDHLAVCAAGRALESAGLSTANLGPRAGLFLAVGFIPFERPDIDALLDGSLDGDRISLERFGTDGFAAVNPLLTFRCLPNMPAYHVSASFDIQGDYFVTYPGPAQFYSALEEALAALAAGRISIALLGAVAHQTNFLVTHHYQRIRPAVPAEHLRDGAGFLVLERESDLKARGGPVRGRLQGFDMTYLPHDLFRAELALSETFAGCESLDGCFGAASLPITLASAGRGTICHDLRSRDGVSASSTWQLA
jgi:3-oxoacyl-(acyl-carrier-protein) synthase